MTVAAAATEVGRYRETSRLVITSRMAFICAGRQYASSQDPRPAASFSAKLSTISSIALASFLGLTALGLAATMTLLSPQLLQLLAAARMAQLAQCLGLNLPDALASDPKALAHLLQRELMRVDQPKA